MIRMTNNEKSILLDNLIEEVTRDKKWIMKEEECDRWCVYENGNYILYKFPIFEDCLEFKGYKYVLEEIDEFEDTEFIVAKWVTPKGIKKYFFTENQCFEYITKGE